MKRAVVLLAAFLTAPLAQAAPANQSAKAFVESLYAAYSQPNAPSPLGKNADKIFTPSLLAKIRADQTRHKGEVGKLDHDPLCDCQDAEGLKLVSIAMKPVTKGQADATVRFMLNTKRKIVRLRLSLTPAGWEVDDVSCPSIKPGLQNFLALP